MTNRIILLTTARVELISKVGQSVSHILDSTPEASFVRERVSLYSSSHYGSEMAIWPSLIWRNLKHGNQRKWCCWKWIGTYNAQQLHDNRSRHIFFSNERWVSIQMSKKAGNTSHYTWLDIDLLLRTRSSGSWKNFRYNSYSRGKLLWETFLDNAKGIWSLY